METITKTIMEYKRVLQELRKELIGLKEINSKTYTYVLKLRQENDRLRAALKPVLDISIDSLERYGVRHESLLGSVIREAQRIYNESEVK